MGNSERRARAAQPDCISDTDLLRQLFAQQRGCRAALDAALRIVWVSDSFAQRFDRPAADCLGCNWFDLYPAAGSLAAEYARALAGETVHLPLIPLPGDPQPRLLSVTLTPWQSPAGEPAAASLYVEEADATDTVVAAAEHVPGLREQFEARRLALIRAISRNGSDGLCALDGRANVLHISPQIEALCGVSAERASGRGGLAFVHPEDLPNCGSGSHRDSWPKARSGSRDCASGSAMPRDSGAGSIASPSMRCRIRPSSASCCTCTTQPRKSRSRNSCADASAASRP
ncbi:MAG: PAS domain-containing protein [Steroidobacteraceae bacterium]